MKQELGADGVKREVTVKQEADPFSSVARSLRSPVSSAVVCG